MIALLVLCLPYFNDSLIVKGENSVRNNFQRILPTGEPLPGIIHKDGNIIEVVPVKYQRRYERWKAEYQSTGFGANQWQTYVEKTDFTLYITISQELEHSAKAGDYKWDDDGRLVSATITLGSKIDSGYPRCIDYPVTCSLAPINLPGGVKGEILAVAKMAHEFGHVNFTATQDASLFQLQNLLIPEYNRIFQLNGFNVDDSRLTGLVKLMKGTPLAISQEREYQAELNVIHFLQEKFSSKGEFGGMPHPIREAIDSYSQESFK